jgi:IrrE N-terminal-like domain
MNDLMNSAVRIENTAQEFWALVGGAPTYPCDIQTAITLALPLEVYPVPGLRVSDVLAWMRRVTITHRIRGRNRRLHGCLLADRGKGTIFFDMQDPDGEQRFTLAHELAHFLLDYQAPRQRALAVLGPSILPVLDGERPPTPEERVYAVLSSVSLKGMSHFMERPDEGLPLNIVIDVENRADRLALELLAPTFLLQERMSRATALRGFTARLKFLTQLLVTEYGLPETIASSYARAILVELGEPTFRDWLFGSAE